MDNVSRCWLGHGILIHCIYFRNNAKNSQQKRSERRDGQKFIESKCSFWESSQEIVEYLKRIIFQYFNIKMPIETPSLLFKIISLSVFSLFLSCWALQYPIQPN